MAKLGGFLHRNSIRQSLDQGSDSGDAPSTTHSMDDPPIPAHPPPQPSHQPHSSGGTAGGGGGGGSRGGGGGTSVPSRSGSIFDSSKETWEIEHGIELNDHAHGQGQGQEQGHAQDVRVESLEREVRELRSELSAAMAVLLQRVGGSGGGGGGEVDGAGTTVNHRIRSGSTSATRANSRQVRATGARPGVGPKVATKVKAKVEAKVEAKMGTERSRSRGGRSTSTASREVEGRATKV